MTGVLQEGDRLQGEDPLLVGALRRAVGLLQEEDHLHAGMDLPAMMALQTGGVTVQLAMTELLQDPTTAHRLDLTTELLPNPLDSLMRAGPRWPSVKPTWSS